MDSVQYISGTTNQTCNFDGPIYGETMPKLRGHQWSYTLAHNNLTGITTQSREITLTIKITDPKTWDSARRLFSFDVQQHAPGMIVVDNVWRTRAYIVANDPQNIAPYLVETQITVVLVDGVWMRDGERVQCAVHTASGDQWLDLPTDLPFDLQAPRMSSNVVNPMLSACDWRMTVYGPAHNPRVRIAGNDYMLDVLIPQGGYVLVDQHDRVITLTQPNGDVSNVIGSAHRGSGLGSGQYIFEPLPAGTSTIEWDGSFGFDLTPILLEVELPWSM